MMAPGANGIDGGVELELGVDERVAALVAAIVRSSLSS
jgi:hypothetical protein